MGTQLPIFAGDGTYASWEKATTGGRFVCSSDSTGSRVLIARYCQAMNQWRKDSGYKEDVEVFSDLLEKIQQEVRPK